MKNCLDKFQPSLKTSLHSQPIAGAVLLTLIFILAGFGVSDWSKKQLRLNTDQTSNQADRPPLYLPEPEYVKLATLGFNNFASDILWFQTINYFGKQLNGTRDYRWLRSMCNLVTTLDAKKGASYEFCANMLAWEARDAEASLAILNRAVDTFPQAWRYLYLRGFTYWYFLNNREKARDDLTRASELPQAPVFLASLASRLMVDTDNPQAAVMFLKNLHDNASSADQKQVLEDKLKRAVVSRDLKFLREAAKTFEVQSGKPLSSLQQLIDAGLLHAIPPEPFGGEYQVDSSGGVTNSSGEQGLEFFGKTKDNGIYSQENQ